MVEARLKWSFVAEGVTICEGGGRTGEGIEGQGIRILEKGLRHPYYIS